MRLLKTPLLLTLIYQVLLTDRKLPTEKFFLFPLLIEKVASDSFTFANDEFIKTLLEIFPKAAKSSGIPSGGQLKARFTKVESMAKRTALIGDQGGSLYLYGLSYLQSLLLIPRVSFENIYI